MRLLFVVQLGQEDIVLHVTRSVPPGEVVIRRGDEVLDEGEFSTPADDPVGERAPPRFALLVR